MKKIISGILCTVLMFTLVITGCSSTSSPSNSTSGSSAAASDSSTADSGNGQKIRVSWWGSQTRHEKTISVLDLYKSKNPDISFEMEYLSGPDYNTKLATQAATSQLPDLFQTDYGWISQYTQKGLIADLQKFVDDGTIDFTNVNKNVVATGQSGGKQYAVPLGINTTSMFYDPEVFKKAGIDKLDHAWTWQDYDKILTEVYKKTNISALPLYYHIPEALAEIIVRQQGYKLFNEDGTSLGFTDPAVIKPMFQRVLDLTKAGVYVSPDIWSTSNTTEDNGLVLGTASTSYGGSNQLISYIKAAGRNLDITAVPAEGTKTGSFVKPSMMFSINEKSSDDIKAKSAGIINFFINDEEAAKILLDERGVPVSTAIREIVKGLSDDDSKKVFEYVEYIEKNQGPADGWAPANSSEVYSVLADLYMQVAFQKITPEDAASSFIEQANEILAKNAK